MDSLVPNGRKIINNKQTINNFQNKIGLRKEKDIL